MKFKKVKTRDYVKKNIFRVVIFSIIIISCLALKPEQKEIYHKVKTEITMEKAIEIGQGIADLYYENLKLIEVHSYDNDECREQTAGEDGKREWWYVDFGNESFNYVSILIQNGNVVNIFSQDESWNNGLISIESIKMTSEEAVIKAQEYGLRGGNPNVAEEWVSGFNFKLSYASFVNSPEDMKIVLEVIGISPQGNFAHIDFDAETGEVLLREEKIVYDSGEEEWKNF